MVALVDPLPNALGRRDVEHDRDLAPKALAPNPEARLLNTPSAARFSASTSAIEPADSLLRGDRRELLEQTRRGPATPEIVRHRERNLGYAGLQQPVIARNSDHTITVAADQRQPLDPASLNQIARRHIRAHHPVKAHIETLRRKPVIKALMSS